MADLHFGKIMVDSEWKYFSLMSLGLQFWSFFSRLEILGPMLKHLFAVTFMMY